CPDSGRRQQPCSADSAREHGRELPARETHVDRSQVFLVLATQCIPLRGGLEAAARERLTVVVCRPTAYSSAESLRLGGGMATRDQRRLSAIVSADVAGYSRLMGADESGTLAALKAHRHELVDPKIAE